MRFLTHFMYYTYVRMLGQKFIISRPMEADMGSMANGRLLALTLALGLLLVTSASTSMAATGTNMTKEQWVQIMNMTPTPGIGCWTASYPNVDWVAAPCSTASVGPLGGPAGTMMTVTGGAPYPNLLPYFLAIIGATAVSSLLLLTRRRSPEQN
jgi:hypothetical protein